MTAPRTVTWGFLGAGGVARRRMLPAVRDLPGIRIGAVMVRDQARAEALAAEFGADAAYDQVDALLADPAVDAVYIATPVNVHCEQVLAAADAGKHVLLEKPMALTTAECDRMLAAVADAGVRLAVCFPMRHTRALRTLRRWIGDGELGELTYLRAQMAKWYPLDPDAWRADPAQSGGGVLVDLGSHLLDAAVWLGGPVTRIAAMTASRAQRLPIEDTAALLLRFASGALGVIELSFAAHTSDNALEVYGTHGVATRTGAGLRRVVGGQPGLVELPPDEDVYRAELRDFTEALVHGHEPATSGDDGRVNVALIRAAYEAVTP